MLFWTTHQILFCTKITVNSRQWTRTLWLAVATIFREGTCTIPRIIQNLRWDIYVYLCVCVYLCACVRTADKRMWSLIGTNKSQWTAFDSSCRSADKLHGAKCSKHEALFTSLKRSVCFCSCNSQLVIRGRLLAAPGNHSSS